MGVAVFVSMTLTIHAQDNERDGLDDDKVYRLTRFAAGAAFSYAQPKEDFRGNVGNGLGLTATFHYHLDRPGWTSVRVDGSFLQYGREERRVPLSRTVGGRVLVDVSTTNTIVGLSVGPELAVPYGPVRPYLNGAFSGLQFRTVSSVSGTDMFDEPLASSTNLSDWTRAWVVGGGLRVPVGGEVSNAAIDLGVRYHRGGQAAYLREGSIIDNPDGSISIIPLVSRTPFVVYSIGFRYRFGFRSADPCSRFVC
jgi:hypothetical protein